MTLDRDEATGDKETDSKEQKTCSPKIVHDKTWRTISCPHSDGTEFVQSCVRRLGSYATSFEVKIVKQPDAKEEGSCVVVGLTEKWVGKGSPWTSRSMRFQTNNGCVLNGNSVVQRTHVHCSEGDVIELSIIYDNLRDIICGIHLNGKLISRYRYTQLPRFATIGFIGGPFELEVDWPVKPPEAQPQEPVDEQTRKDNEEKHERKRRKIWFGSDSVKISKEQEFTLLPSTKASTKTVFTVLRLAALIPHVYKNELYNAFFEMEVVDGAGGTIAFGIGDVVFDEHLFPGDDPNSFGYCSDGTIKSSKITLLDGHPYGTGDKIGVGLLYMIGHSEHKSKYIESSYVLVYFTKNGQVISQQLVEMPAGGFYPNIGFKKGGTIRLMPEPVGPTYTQEEREKFLKQSLLQASYNMSTKMQFDGKAMFSIQDSAGTPRLAQRISQFLKLGAFFRIKIKSISADGSVSVGAATKQMPKDGYRLGAAPSSCGYQSRDGSLNGFGEQYFSQPLGKGGSIGVWVQHMDASHVIMVFTNDKDKLMGKTELMRAGEVDNVYPTLTLEGTSCQVVVEWPDKVESRPMFISTASNPVALLRDLGQWFCFTGIRVASASTLKLFTKSSGLRDGYVGAQSLAPLSQGGVTYFEAKVNSNNASSPVIVGLAPSIILLRMPVGSDLGSFGIDVSLGRFYCGKESGELDTAWSPSDRLGIGITFSPDAPKELVEQNVIIYVTKNGQRVHQIPIKMAAGGLFPMVSFNRIDDSVEFDFNAKPSSAAAAVDSGDIGMTFLAADSADDSFNQLLSLPMMDEDDDDLLDDLLDDDQDERLTHLFISHSDRCQSLAKTLKKQAAGKYRVTLSSDAARVEQRMDEISAAAIHVVIITRDYIVNSDLVQEFMLIKSQGNSVIVLTASDVAWPPGGSLVTFERFFRERERDELVLTFEEGQEDYWTQVADKIDLAILLKKEHAKKKSDESRTGGRGIYHLYEIEGDDPFGQELAPKANAQPAAAKESAPKDSPKQSSTVRQSQGEPPQSKSCSLL